MTTSTTTTEPAAPVSVSAPAPAPTRRINNSPSHFLALRVNEPALLAKAKEVQDKIGERNPEVKPLMANLARAHITLLALYLYDRKTLAAAATAIRNCRSIIAKVSFSPGKKKKNRHSLKTSVQSFSTPFHPIFKGIR